ncbi:unnamed protein product [Polarella glacialis]|uniref:carbonic anhydrase n=1 Tax=Polarella glacialis TaxID=89957 RepID=A0A813G490_POLGL|nr:unnamed protein product [Polarella glacialis]
MADVEFAFSAPAPESASISTFSPLAMGLALGLLAAVVGGRPALAADLENGFASAAPIAPASSASAHWNYILPQSWQTAYPACASTSQSPINIDTTAISGTAGSSNLYSLSSYTPAAALSVRNTGHGLQVDASPAGALGSLSLSGVTYNVLQFHLHFPSEHTVDGAPMLGEMHIVHQKSGSTGLNDLLVVGVFFQAGTDHPLLTQMGLPSGAPTTSAETMPITGAAISLADMFQGQLQGSFYHYEGSLTTPPCSETVKWFVLENTATASYAQAKAFMATQGATDNSRPVQLRNGRPLVKGVTSVTGMNISADLVECASPVA